LLLLIAESLSRLVKQTQREGKLKGLKITSSEVLSHLLFVDDLILFWCRFFTGFYSSQKGFG
jgi:hypothetical protein